MLRKAVKIELMLLMEANLSDEEIVKWVKDAMLNFCDFERAVVTVKESHDRLLHDPEQEFVA